MKYILTVRGCRGSFPHMGGSSNYGIHTSCLTLESEKEIFLFDAGSGLQSYLKETGAGQKKKEKLHLFLSHLHYDHVSGLYECLGLMQAAEEIHVYGPAEGGRGIRQELDRLIGPPYWPLTFSEMGKGQIVFHDLEPGMRFQAGALSVSTAAAPHPDGCLWYRLDSLGAAASAETKDAAAARRGFLYGLDGELTEESISRLIPFAEGTELAVLDAQYTPEELPERKGWGHSSYRECLGFARRAELGTVLLSHFQPYYSDETLRELETAAKALSERAVFAREGMKKELEL